MVLYTYQNNLTVWVQLGFIVKKCTQAKRDVLPVVSSHVETVALLRKAPTNNKG